MILVAYGIEIKGRAFEVEDRFGDFDFHIHFTIHQVNNWKTKQSLIGNIDKNATNFEVQIKNEIQPKENIVDGQVKEK